MATRSQSPGDLQDFWQEFKEIESSKPAESEEEDASKTPDEGEQEAAWLQEAGYGFLVNNYEAGKELAEDEIHALTSSLPRNHAAVVKKRIDTLNATLRKKQKYTTKIDVRNIFPQQRNSEKVVIHSEPVEDADVKSSKQKIVRPSTLPPGLKLSSFHDNSNVWIKQDSVTNKQSFSPKSHKLHKIIGNHSISSKIQGHMHYVDEESIEPVSDLESRNATKSSPFVNKRSPKSPLCDREVFLVDSVDGYHCNRLQGQQRSRSSSQDSVSPLTSPSRSKSSSCDTLDSLDSGLELSSSTLTESNSENFSSRDSLDTVNTIPVTIESVYSYQVGHFYDPEENPYLASLIENEIGSSYGSPDLLEEPVSPILVAFGKWKDEDCKISPRRSSTNKYVSNILIELPKSPTSPRNEVVHPEWANNRAARGRGSLLKNKGEYSMSGMTAEVGGNAELGVEMLSMEHKGTVQKRNSQLSPISDSDITFDFSIEENGNNGINHLEKSTTLMSKSGDSLPNFSLVHDKLGITYIQDISGQDLDEVKKLALLELTAMFDTHNIMYSRRRSKRKHRDHGIFGVALTTMLEHDQKLSPRTKIPLVFNEILSYLEKNCLETEGILRIPGSTSRVKQLRLELEEKFYNGTFIWSEDVTTNDVAALMKQFLRELPTPLLTYEYIEAFAQVENLTDKKQQLHALNLLILLLPTVHRNMLQALLEFLEKVIDRSNVNKMSLSNVAMIMAPNLFIAPKVNSHPSKGQGAWEIEIKMAAGTSNIMKMLIKYKTILWTIPSYLLSMVRRNIELEQIRKNRDKTKIKFLAKKDKTEVYKKPAIKHEADFHDGVIRVQAPNLTKASMAIQLDGNMTAADIVAKFRLSQGSQTLDPRKSAQNKKTAHSSQGHMFSDPRNFTFAGDNTYLFEVGGNICERCLQDDTNMMALYRVNPNAEWIIKHRE